MRYPPELLLRLVLAAASLAVALLAAEAGTRALSSLEGPLDYRDAVVGKTYVPSFAKTVYVDECDCDIFLRFNREGFRGPDLPYAKPAGVRRLAVIGDSMIASVATPEELTLVPRLETLLNDGAAGGPRWEVMNFGVSGSSTAQELVLYRERVHRYDPDVVVLAFFLRNDPIDNSPHLSTNPRIYFDLKDGGELVALPFSPARASRSRWLSEHSRFYVWQKLMFSRIRGEWSHVDRTRDVYIADPDGDLAQAWQLTDALLRRFAREVTQDGTRFFVTALPPSELVYDDVWDELRARAGPERERFRREFPEQHVARTCREASIPFISMTEDFRSATPHASSTADGEVLYFERIGHFNEHGNEVAAQSVARALSALAEKR